MPNNKRLDKSNAPKPKLVAYSDAPQIRDFLKSQTFSTISPVTTSTIANPSVKNHTIIITGANCGLGLEAAKQFAQLEHVSRLVLACRNINKGESAREEIESGLASERRRDLEIVVWELDMARKASIVAFSDRALSELNRIDAIVLNAGVDLASYEKAADEDGGYEMTLMVNVVGTMMLAILMVPVLLQKKLKGMETSRITIVGSAVQFMTKYDVVLDAAYEQTGEGILGWLSDEGRWKEKITQDRYYLSKGLLQMLVEQMAVRISNSVRREGKDMVIVNCVAPGYCKTELFRTSATRASRVALRVIGRESSVGARALLVGAIGKEGGEQSHGRYMSEGRVKRCSSWFETEQGRYIAQQMWEELQEEIEKSRPAAVQAL